MDQMTSHTFQDLLPSSPPIDLAPTIQAIVEGDFSRSRLAAFSDLDRASARRLRERWLEIPNTERHALVLALGSLSEVSVDFDFHRVFRIALSDPDPVIRQLAVDGLWEDSGSDLPAILLDMVESDPSDDVRSAAIAALAPVCDAIAAGESDVISKELLIDRFAQFIEDPSTSPLVRRRSLATIAAFATEPRVADLIRSGLDDEDQTVVAGAIEAMGRTASAMWLDTVVELMKSDDAELRYESALAAGSIGEADAVPELGRLLDDHDAEVRSAAITALAAIGGSAALRLLAQVAADEDYEDRDAVESALGAIEPYDTFPGVE